MKTIYIITFGKNYYESGGKEVTCRNYIYYNKEDARKRFFLLIDEKDEVALNNLNECINNDYTAIYTGDNGLRSYQVKFEKKVI